MSPATGAVTHRLPAPWFGAPYRDTGGSLTGITSCDSHGDLAAAGGLPAAPFGNTGGCTGVTGLI